MARTRKTLEVKALIDSLHSRLAKATDLEKPMICSIIEDILFDANAYAGFGYSFYNHACMLKYGDVDAAIAAGEGTEYDRRYATHKLLYDCLKNR